MESIVSSQDRLHFFEYLEADILQQYIRTGIHYFVNTLLNGYPELIKFRYYSHQIAALIDFFKDLYYLLRHNKTYAEDFYNFERKDSTKNPLLALKSAIIWTIIPYLLTKLDIYYNKIVGEQIDGKNLSLLNKIIKSVYPYLYVLFSVIQVIYKFRYLYIHNDKEYFYSLLFKIDKLKLGHMKNIQPSKYPVLQLVKKPGILLMLVGHKILTWYFNNKRRQKTQGKNEQTIQVAAPISERDISQRGKCPICTKLIRNSTIVKTTGFVYCYDCISSYARRQGKCPMSQAKISLEHLQIIYN